MNQVSWTRTALENLRFIRTYIEQFNPGAAQDLAACLLAAGNSLVHFPLRGRRVPHTNMREMVAISPYVIRYRVDGETVVILRIRHAARRPTAP